MHVSTCHGWETCWRHKRKAKQTRNDYDDARFYHRFHSISLTERKRGYVQFSELPWPPVGP